MSSRKTFGAQDFMPEWSRGPLARLRDAERMLAETRRQHEPCSHEKEQLRAELADARQEIELGQIALAELRGRVEAAEQRVEAADQRAEAADQRAEAADQRAEAAEAVSEQIPHLRSAMRALNQKRLRAEEEIKRLKKE